MARHCPFSAIAPGGAKDGEDVTTGRWSRVIAVLASLCVAACNTVAPNRLALADTAQLHFTGIEVRTGGAAVNWTDAEDAYLKSRNLSLTDPTLLRTPEAAAYIRGMAGQCLKAALERALASRPKGAPGPPRRHPGRGRHSFCSALRHRRRLADDPRQHRDRRCPHQRGS